MSEKRYQKVCDHCHKPFVASLPFARFCDPKCKAQWHRDKRVADTASIIQSQGVMIRTQAKILRQVIPDPDLVKKVSCETGKDLTECKRPDGSHLYTETDLWILVSKLAEVGYNPIYRNSVPASGPSLLSVLHINQVSQELIWDFERRFKCRFDDVRRSNHYIHTNGSDDEEIIKKYAQLQYSR